MISDYRKCLVFETATTFLLPEMPKPKVLIYTQPSRPKAQWLIAKTNKTMSHVPCCLTSPSPDICHLYQSQALSQTLNPSKIHPRLVSLIQLDVSPPPQKMN